MKTKILTIIPILAIAAFGVFIATGVTSAQSGDPGTPKSLAVAPTDTTAVISWDAPDANVGEGEQCDAVDYSVRVEAVTDGDSVRGSEVQSPWTATGLNPSTRYAVEVYAYGDCDEYSAVPAEATFSTTAADSNPEDTSDEKHAPKRVRDLTANRVDAGSATVSWTAPRTKNGKHYAATEYVIDVMNVVRGGKNTLAKSVYDITDTSATVDGLSAGKYRFRVAAYNSECDCWGKYRSIPYTHQ